MHSKKNEKGGMTQNYPMNPGPYTDAMKSPQGVPCGSGNVKRYMCESLEREYDVKPMWKDHWDRARHKVSAQEMFQGSYTFRLARDKPEDME